MKQIFTLYITKSTAQFSDGKINVNDFDMSKSYGGRPPECVLLGKIEQEIDVPAMSHEELTQAQVDLLEASIQQERAASQGRVNLLLDRISKLKAIGHDVSEVPEQAQ